MIIFLPFKLRKIPYLCFCINLSHGSHREAYLITGICVETRSLRNLLRNFDAQMSRSFVDRMIPPEDSKLLLIIRSLYI